MIFVDNLVSYMTQLVNPLEGQELMVAGDKKSVMFMDLIASVCLTNNRSGIIKAFNEDYFPFIDVSMYMNFCIDKHAKDAIIELGGDPNLGEKSKNCQDVGKIVGCGSNP